MEKFLISLDDVKEVIWISEENGDGFQNVDGQILCSIRKKAVTYWVLYRKGSVNDGKQSCFVDDAYCHRMQQREDQ
jgi:hypothetical protein